MLRLSRIVCLMLLLGSLGARPAHADPSRATGHTVQPGETLWQIAQSAGADPAELLRLNQIEDGNLIVVGQTLKLPAKAPPPSTTYTVADGDTLSGIASRLNVSVSALTGANPLDDPDRLKVGAQLVVPGSTSAGSQPPVAVVAAPAAPAPAPKKRGVVTSYTVQPGETLSQIARQLDVTADAIAQASSLDDPNRLSVGTVLKIPLPGHEHVVAEGETLRDIALRFKVDLGSLVDFNEIEDAELIRVGQVLVIPAPAQRAASVEAPPAPVAASTPKPSPSPSPAATAAPKPSATPAPAAAAPKPVAAPAPNPNGDGLVANAQKLLGTPYVWGGSSPSGFDCSGFVWFVARQSGKQVSRGLRGQYDSGSHPARNELKAGDLVFFQNTYTPGLSHNGIYVGNDKFVHAVSEQSGVTTSSLSSAYWTSHWFGATRLP